MSDRLVRETGNKAPANATADENAWLRLALRAIEGPADSGPFIEAYRDAGGGYEGLQAVATFALESVGREPASARPAPDGQGSDQSPGPEPSTESWGSNQSENSRVVGEREKRLREAFSTGLRLLEQGTQSSRRAGVEVAELEEARVWLASVQASEELSVTWTIYVCPIHPDAVRTLDSPPPGERPYCPHAKPEDPHKMRAVEVAALASSPSPPDREPEGLTEGEVQAILRNLPNEPGFHRGFGGNFNSAVAKLRAMFGPVRGDES